MVIEMLFLFAIAVAVVEAMLSHKWNLPYFRSGLPVYRQSRQAAVAPLPTMDATELESLMGDSKKYPRLMFRQVDGDFLVFREAFLPSSFSFKYTGIGWYQPAMHGNLTIDPTRSRIEVIGRLNWSHLALIPAFAVALVSWSLEPASIWFIMVMLGVFSVIYVVPLAFTYLIQRKLFARVADVAAEHVNAA